MAECVVDLECRMAWWVRPYLSMAALFVRSVELFLDLDDDRLDRFLDRQSAFIAKHGVRFYCNGKRV